MKKIIFTSILCFYSLTCLAQQTEQFVRVTEANNGEKVAFVDEKVFDNAVINGVLKIEVVLKPNSIDKVINILGEPKELKHEISRAIDGTIITESKILVYLGVKFIYSKHDSFVLSSIEFTSDRGYLCLAHEKLHVGTPIKKIKSFLPQNTSLTKKGTISIAVAKEWPSGKLKMSADGMVMLGFKNLNIQYNPATGKVSKLSITIRRI